MTTAQQIGAAVLAKLQADTTLKGLVFFIEEADAQSSFEELLATVQLPAVAVGYLGSDFEVGDESEDLRLQSATIAVLVFCDDLRGYVMAMNEPTGAHAILKQCADVLYGETLGLELQRGLTIDSERPLLAVPGRMVWQQVWTTQFYR